MKCVSIKVRMINGTIEEIDLYVEDTMTDEDILSSIKKASLNFCKASGWSSEIHGDFSYLDFVKYAKRHLDLYNSYFKDEGIIFANSIPTRSISVDNKSLL